MTFRYFILILVEEIGFEYLRFCDKIKPQYLAFWNRG